MKNSYFDENDTFDDFHDVPDNDNNLDYDLDCHQLDDTINELISLTSLKWIFVGGKGGVGKTTTSCSIAVELSKHRKSVLILSTDPAHNLSDAFNQKFLSKPTLVDGFDNLYAMEIDTKVEETFEFKLSKDSGFKKLLPELLETFPGIDEALSFAHLMQSVQSMEYSTIVLDTAPTGHTLRLLSFPSLLENVFVKLGTVKQQMSNAINMINSLSGETPEDDLSAKIDNLKAVTTSVKKTFQDPTKTTFVCVCIPEFLSVYETERLIQELARQEIDCMNVVVNQVIFPIDNDEVQIAQSLNTDSNEVSNNQGGNESSKDQNYVDNVTTNDPSIKENIQLKKDLQKITEKLKLYQTSHVSRRKIQSKYLSQIMDLYSSEFHVVFVPQQTVEIRGVERLKKFAQLLLQHKENPMLI